MRLIDADALKYEIATIMPSRIEVSLVVDKMPDAVVRCKDCKHYHKGFNCDLMQKPIFKDDNWFCADGEART